MSSSSEPHPTTRPATRPVAAVVTGAAAASAVVPSSPELRTGLWTRLGGHGVLGDTATEESLALLAERTRAAAQAQGYATGWMEGRREAAAAARVEAAEVEARAASAEAQRATEHRAALAALQQAAQRLHDVVGEVCAQVEESATGLALALTSEILDRELGLSADPGADAVRRALRLLPPSGMVRVRLHPDDLSSPAVEAATAASLSGCGVTLVGDPGLARGDAVVEADDHVVDLRISTALERLREVLS
ncbi:FliH/SctL family protein [Nocardioides sp.]|uniref:FliH/SctL family protein n=1 Tax=Nocardioides sp. TaxID=35761 RepID=UPI002734528C|nr:FliH/SctL family protein [Nocardioides sp.]MDP3890243.1 FliH/SctL family protein [Nocardioides sp.]